MNSYIKNIMTIFSLCFLISCTDNLNFDEINLNVEPVLTAPLIYFDLDQNDFFDYTSDTEIPLITDASDFRVFKSSAIRNDVFKVVLILKLKTDLIDLLKLISFFMMETITLPELFLVLI